MRRNDVNLINEFLNYGYHDITTPTNALNYGLNIELFYNQDEDGMPVKPEELYRIFVSKYCDELFLVLNGDNRDLPKLCSRWDQKAILFSNFGSTGKSALEKLMYNMVQLILCAEEDAGQKFDRSIEQSLDTTRKLLPCRIEDEGQIFIEESNAVEIPFHLIREDTIQPDSSIIDTLHDLMPKAGDGVDFLLKCQKSGKRKQHKQKNFDDDNYNAIKGWLIKDDPTFYQN